MITFAIVTTWILSAWKLGKWEKIHEMSPTILFYMVFNLLYNVIYFGQLLWKYQSKTPFLDHTTISLLFIFITVPCTIIIFLSYLPKHKSYLYIAFWVVFYSIIEWISNKFHLFSYHNGWSFKWSVIFNIIMFSIFSIHYRKPIIAVVISLFVLLGLFLISPPSFEKMI